MEPTVHILLIEDNPADARLIREFLLFSESQHYRLFHSPTLAEGRRILESQTIDLVLLDLYLPDSLGLDSFDKLMQSFSDYPVIVLTGLSDERMGLQAVRTGAQDFLSKDELNQETLLRSIRYSLERHQMIHRLEQAQEMALIGNWKYDPNTDNLYCSRSAQRLLGLNPEGGDASLPIEQALAHLLPSDQKRLKEALQQTLDTRTELRVDVEVAEQKRFLSIQGRLEAEDRRTQAVVVGTLQDITDRKERETLIRQKELAEQRARLKQEFLANTSHEIRTPLNAILQLTKILLREEPRNDQVDYLNLVKSAGQTLLAVVNDVLDLSKIEAGKMDFSQAPFRLSPLLNSVIEMFSPRAQEEDISLELRLAPQLPDLIIGDSTRLSQILINLVNNAIKYTERGAVSLEVRLKKQEGPKAWLEFEVKDTGIGIPKHQLSAIFDSFQRLDTDLNRRHSGTGLGLTIVEQLVKRQDGNLSVKSEEGKGSVFTFCLPFELADSVPAIKEKPSLADSCQLKGVRILLVEDNSLNQLVAKKILEDWGVKLTLAEHGKAAIACLEKADFDLILMDLQMPVMDGYETTRFIRNQLAAPVKDIPIVAVTANAFSGMDDECLQAGMDDYLSKPFETGSLFEKIVNNLKQKAPPSMFTPHSSPSFSPRTQADQIDLTYLKEVSAGDDFIIKLAIEKYLEKTPEMLSEMDELLEQQEFQAFAQRAHKLKSSVATIGMNETRKDLSSLEKWAREGRNLQQIPQQWAALQPELHSAMKDLKSFLGSLSTTNPISR
jgi:signal transduction histidine kinase/HPt (histidine-containing phosphotransfer) domain-containing protein/BarA-like signal transduction histidine kinase